MFEWITGLMNSMGYFGIVLLMALENVFPPIPSELIMPLAGYLVTQDKMTFIGVVLAGTVGSVLGSLPLYFAGKKMGHHRAREWAGKYGHWLTISPQDIDKSRDWMDKHGVFAVCLCRLVPGIRSLIALPAGVDQMNPFVFIAYTALGSSIWATILAALGYFLGSNFDNVERFMNPISYVVLAIVIGIYIYRVVKQKKSK
jgi:membrane protein DedA with SNARE-associated domain